MDERQLQQQSALESCPRGHVDDYETDFLLPRLQNLRIKGPLLLQEEDSLSLMDKDRRRQAIQVKVRRLRDSMARARKERQGLTGTSRLALLVSCPQSLSSPDAFSPQD